jgi:phosphopantetheinyl transferase
VTEVRGALLDEIDDHLGRFVVDGTRNLLAPRDADGPFHVLRDRWRSAPARDMIIRRYLDGRELAIYQAATPLRQQSLLAGRVALKDAVRTWLTAHGHKALRPIEIEIHADRSGRPGVRGPWAVPLHVSLAHKDGIAVAMCADSGAVGIDLEKIESRSDEFVGLALTESEQELLPATGRDGWVTRIWTAKEAIAKADGTGLRGSPRSFVVSQIAGDRLLVNGRWVRTQRLDDDHVVAWTEPC